MQDSWGGAGDQGDLTHSLWDRARRADHREAVPGVPGAGAAQQPLFFLVIFGKVLPGLGQTNGGYATLLLPGIAALAVVRTSLQTTALPLVVEFIFIKIEGRLLALISVTLVGAKKLAIGTIRALIAALIIFPVGRLILSDSLRLSTAHIPLLLLVLGAPAGPGAGLALGTAVRPQQINMIFSIVLTPLIFTGCTYYPWTLLDRIRWFRMPTLFNPLTYTSEGLRHALVPGSSSGSMLPAAVLVSCALFGALGLYASRPGLRCGGCGGLITDRQGTTHIRPRCSRPAYHPHMAQGSVCRGSVPSFRGIVVGEIIPTTGEGTGQHGDDHDHREGAAGGLRRCHRLRGRDAADQVDPLGYWWHTR